MTPQNMMCHVVIACGLAGAVGCTSSSSGASMAEPEATALPPIKVDLPPPPSFAASDVPVKLPDGTYTVYGLRKGKAELFGKEVKVKAYLLEVYQCPVCPKGQTC